MTSRSATVDDTPVRWLEHGSGPVGAPPVVLVARSPAPALLPAIGTLLVRGHDRLDRAREALPVHCGPGVLAEEVLALVRTAA